MPLPRFALGQGVYTLASLIIAIVPGFLTGLFIGVFSTYSVRHEKDSNVRLLELYGVWKTVLAAGVAGVLLPETLVFSGLPILLAAGIGFVSGALGGAFGALSNFRRQQ
jgi:hypothetical protein